MDEYVIKQEQLKLNGKIQVLQVFSVKSSLLFCMLIFYNKTLEKKKKQLSAYQVQDTTLHQALPDTAGSAQPSAHQRCTVVGGKLLCAPCPSSSLRGVQTNQAGRFGRDAKPKFDLLVWGLVPFLISCSTLGKLFNFSVPQFHHLQSVHNTVPSL